MTWRNDRNRISSIRGTYGAKCLRPLDLFRNLAVAAGFAKGNRKQRRPDSFLKLGPLEIEFQRKGFSLAREIIFQLALRFEKVGSPGTELEFAL